MSCLRQIVTLQPVWRGALVADVHAPAFPTDHQKTTMKDLITSEPTIFDERREIFGTASGMAILEELQMMKDSIAAQDSGRPKATP